MECQIKTTYKISSSEMGKLLKQKENLLQNQYQLKSPENVNRFLKSSTLTC